MEWPAIKLPGKRCLAALLLFFLALGGADVPAAVPLTDITAAEAALRFVVHKGNEAVSGGWVACVGLFDESGVLPAKLIEPLIAENPGLHPVSACRNKDSRFYLVDGRKPVPFVGCGTWSYEWRAPARPGTIKITCHIHHGPLNGTIVGFDVMRAANGALEATENGERMME